MGGWSGEPSQYNMSLHPAGSGGIHKNGWKAKLLGGLTQAEDPPLVKKKHDGIMESVGDSESDFSSAPSSCVSHLSTPQGLRLKKY